MIKQTHSYLIWPNQTATERKAHAHLQKQYFALVKIVIVIVSNRIANKTNANAVATSLDVCILHVDGEQNHKSALTKIWILSLCM